MASISQKK
ncbi:hypothetical protein RDI58_011915 [Solanum bulbocastanum]|uniref:Uncharacterized protein n=1 Tax=Solanum bulbocastanum TaxID=147425 RepID=A0AAN8YGQ8_SOLBU